MASTTNVIVFPAPGQVALQTRPLPFCGDDEIVVQTRYTFVSPGTELRILAGTKESKDRFPVIPGYSVIGQIVEVGGGVQGWSIGEWISGRNPLPIEGLTSLWGGQASRHRYKVTGEDRPVRLPPSARPWDYVVAEVGAIAWRGVTLAMPAPGETAVVIGQGMIGALAAKWLLYHGARVIVVDLEESRLQRALRWGATAAISGRGPDVVARVRAHAGDGADIIVEASASAEGARLARRVVRSTPTSRPRVGYRIDQLRANAAHWPRLAFLATYTDTIEASPDGGMPDEGAIVLTPRDRTVEDRQAVIEQIRRGTLDTSDFLDAPDDYRDAPHAYLRLRDHPAEVSALAFEWPE